MSKKSSREDRRPALMSKELLKISDIRRKFTECGNKGLFTWDEYRNVVRVCRRKTKTCSELNLTKDEKATRRASSVHL